MAQCNSAAQAAIADCDARLARYQAALDAGGDVETIAEWTRKVRAEQTALQPPSLRQPAAP